VTRKLLVFYDAAQPIRTENERVALLPRLSEKIDLDFRQTRRMIDLVALLVRARLGRRKL
jgi:uncharacterized protein (UPF0262 family)